MVSDAFPHIILILKRILAIDYPHSCFVVKEAGQRLVEHAVGVVLHVLLEDDVPETRTYLIAALPYLHSDDFTGHYVAAAPRESKARAVSDSPMQLLDM
jgi:hypothetical protein